MSVPKQSGLQQLSTFELQARFNTERDIIFSKLMRYYTITHASMEVVLTDLRIMHTELEKRKSEVLAHLI